MTNVFDSVCMCIQGFTTCMLVYNGNFTFNLYSLVYILTKLNLNQLKTVYKNNDIAGDGIIVVGVMLPGEIYFIKLYSNILI